MKSPTNSDANTETTEAGTETSRVEDLVRALRRLFEGDEQEQRETFEYLKTALEEDRPSHRRLFNE